MDLKWTVWKHSGLKSSYWKQKLDDTDDEGYARHVFRYICDVAKGGKATVELRYGEVVREQMVMSTAERMSGSTASTKHSPENHYPLKTDPVLAPLAATNHIFGTVYKRYKNGELSFIDMLAESVIILADWDNVGRNLENYLWETNPDAFPAGKINTQGEAKKRLTYCLQSATQHIEEVVRLLNYLKPSDKTLTYLVTGVSQDLNYLESISRRLREKRINS